MKAIRAERVKIDAKLAKEKQQTLEERRKKASVVKYMEAETSKKLQEHQEEKLARAKRNYEEKKLKEILKQEKVKSQLSELENAETQFLELLQQRQSVHKEAFEELERALSITTKNDFVKASGRNQSMNFEVTGLTSKSSSKADLRPLK